MAIKVQLKREVDGVMQQVNPITSEECVILSDGKKLNEVIDFATIAEDFEDEDFIVEENLVDRVESIENRIDSEFEQQNSQIATGLSNIKTVEQNISNKVDTEVAKVNAQLSQKASEQSLAVERARIDSLTKLNEGSTTGDAELIDARIGADGVTYNNLGTAIRTQFNALPFIRSEESKIMEIEPIWNAGYCNSTGLINSNNSNYSYSQKIEVKKGDVITVSGQTSNGTYVDNIPMRFLCAYIDENVNIIGGFDSGKDTFSIEDNTTSIIITCDTTNYKNHVITIATTKITQVLDESASGTLGEKVYKNVEKIEELEGKLSNLPFDEKVESKDSINNIVPNFTNGYVNGHGQINSHSTYSYSQKISVKEGDVVSINWKLTNGVEQIGIMRFVCAYKGDTAIASSGVNDGVSSYTVPSDIDAVIISCDTSNYNSHVIQHKTTETTKKLVVENQEFIISKVLGNGVISGSASSLTTGESLELEENSVSKNKYLSFSCDITELKNGIIRIGHGKATYNASYLEITKTNLTIYKYSYMLEEMKKVEHGLNISNYVKVNIKVGADNKVNVTLFTTDGAYTLQGVYWTGRSGKIFAEPENCTITDVKMNWYCDDYKKSIYAFGDSYFEVTGNNRWTSYLIANGYDNLLLDHYSGRKTQVAYESFLKSLEHGTPRFVLWCMGMNDPDGESEINLDWKDATDKFIAKCNEKNIIPILCTIPNVKGGAVDDTDISAMRLHDFKNTYVRESGYRYIDFYKAVGANDVNWFPNMLYSDGVHPDVLGAEAMYHQAIVDFPELMQK